MNTIKAQVLRERREERRKEARERRRELANPPVRKPAKKTLTATDQKRIDAIRRRVEQLERDMVAILDKTPPSRLPPGAKAFCRRVKRAG